MGLAASQARFLNLTGRLSLVQKQGQFINQQRTAIANELNKMMNGDNNNVAAANPFIRGGGDTPEYFGKSKSGKNKNSQKKNSGESSNSFESALSSLFSAATQNYPGANKCSMNLNSGKLAELQSQDARLELILRTLDTQEQALQTEISAVNKVIDKNIEQSFKLMA